jgi:EAL and modified HD-GYP domain-containing signal transduction protein
MKDSQETPSVAIARRPVFNDKGRLWGYELFCVGGAETPRGGLPCQSDTAINVAAGAYLCLQQILQGGRKIIVDFTEKSVLDKFPYVLPPVFAAIKVGEESSQQPSFMEVMNHLKADGYPIAIRNFTGNPDYDPLYHLAGIMAIETQNKAKDVLQADLAQASQYKTQLLADEVQDRTMYEVCQGLKFSLFSGPFFKYPDKVTLRKLSSNEILRFKLLEFVETEDPDVPRIVETIQSDATISFRFLTFLNSAAFAFSQRIKSIQQAVSLLGWRSIKNWLRVILLTDMSQSKEAEELVLLSAQRGMFLELLVREHDFWGFEPGSIHLLGLFSLLDTLLALPMTEIVSHLPIDNKLKAALCREPNNEYAPLLRLAQFFEEAKWTEVDAMIQQLNLNHAKVMDAFQKSVHFSSGLESLRSSMARSPNGIR